VTAITATYITGMSWKRSISSGGTIMMITHHDHIITMIIYTGAASGAFPSNNMDRAMNPIPPWQSSREPRYLPSARRGGGTMRDQKAHATCCEGALR